VTSSQVGRKVKCSEERPICGHCHRLQLNCLYDAPAELRGRSSSLPRQQDTTSFSSGPSGVPRQDSLGGENSTVNPPVGASLGYVEETFPDYGSSLVGNLAPNFAFNGQPGNQTAQRHSSSNTWELELLGEDSLWANIPIIPNFISVQSSPPYEFVSSVDIPRPMTNPGTSGNSQVPHPTPSIDGAGRLAVPLPTQNALDQSSFYPADEIVLLRHFVDFAVPPILIGIEPRWNTSRDALLRLSKSNLSLRHSICAFSALSLGDSPGSQASTAAQSSSFYANLAMNELNTILDEQCNDASRLESHESILASIFFLSYVELIVSNAPKSSVDLLDRAHTLVSNKPPSSSPLYNQLQVWLKLLDAKLVSAGGKGFHLHTIPDTQDLDFVRESYDLPSANSEPNVPTSEAEDILFNSLNRQAFNFYLQVLNFSGRIAHLDKWHRSRGSVQDELEVMLASDKIVRDLNALWTRRPAIIDLADQKEQLRRYMSLTLATRVEHHLRTYTANFYACFIHLQRAAYARLEAISQVKPAVAKIVHLSRITIEEGHVLPVSMLWPLMMAACEADDEITQNTIINFIEGMGSKVGNAIRTANLVREIVKRQKSGQRADARTVMQEAFGEVFAII
jgi:hypothetical protein